MPAALPLTALPLTALPKAALPRAVTRAGRPKERGQAGLTLQLKVAEPVAPAAFFAVTVTL